MFRRAHFLQALLAVATITATTLPAINADAFCGFYVSSNDEPLYNSATQVVMMREDTKTVLSMRNNYKGPAEDFAMVIPVPQVLQQEQVKTLDEAVFNRLNKFTAPRLVEYFERDPCYDRRRMMRKSAIPSMAEDQMIMESGGAPPAVMVEAEFEVGEYEVVILSAKESSALQTWLKENKYNIPDGAEEVLQGYISQGQYFFVAKVNVEKVKFDKDNNAVLSPLRFHYDSEDFSLPVRLGLLNAQGHQDLIVHILSREGRYEVANGKNLTIPTNLFVDEAIKDRFTDFYEALFSKVHEENPTAIITEYAWGGEGVRDQQWTAPPVKCDPCTEPVSQPWQKELLSLGADLLEAPKARGNTGLIVSETNVSTLEVTSAPQPQPEVTELSDATQEPQAPVEYKAAHIQDNLLEFTAQINTCYEQFSRRQGQQLSVIDLKLQLSPDGTVTSIGSPYNDSTQQHLANTIASCAKLKNIVFPAFTHTTSVEALVRLQFEVDFVDSTWLELNRWTITRLHARYTAAQLENDIYFKLSAPIQGGRGTPVGSDPTLPTTPSKDIVNNFQARYIILHPYTKWHMCMNPKPGNWTGSGATGAPTGLNAKPPTSKGEIQLMRVVENKKGWLPKAK